MSRASENGDSSCSGSLIIANNLFNSIALVVTESDGSTSMYILMLC